MRSILLDELLPREVAAIKEYLAANATPSGVEDLYWLDLPKTLWNENQIACVESGLRDSPKNFRLAIEAGAGWIRFELLVRSDCLHNLGGGQADARQVLFALNWADKMAVELNLTSCLPPERH